MQPLWSFSELSAALGGDAEGGSARAVTGVSIDTRTLEPGDLFVALKDQRDGHDFVAAAFKAGAAAALVAESYQRQAGDGALFRVADPLKGLEALGRAARQRLGPSARVIAVTGSAGKTGTKEMLRACLAKLGPTHASEKSYNNHWGVPLTLARMPRDTRYGVFEIGMNHAGEIRAAGEDGPSARGDNHDGRSRASRALRESSKPSPMPKPKSSKDLMPGGAAIIKHDNPSRLAAEDHCGKAWRSSQ